MVFHEGAGKVTNTIPPGDYSSCELLNETVQNAPASTRDPELMGSIAAIGVVMGKPFPPTGYRTLDARSAFFYGVTGITAAMSMRLPGKGFMPALRLYSPLEPFFAKTWRPSEVELVK
ncbi:MAG TPA: hypothetical protein PLS93_20060 [Accumulibacter sp.]|nr:hypothetical protein [Accumulibacter sp.]